MEYPSSTILPATHVPISCCAVQMLVSKLMSAMQPATLL
jgi:hypothetical protein